MLRTSTDLMKENCLKLAKERSRRYPTQTITDADYVDDIALLENTPTAQAEFLLHSLERAGQMEYMCFNQRGDISTLQDSPSCLDTAI